jgi:hypothetical protein
MYFAACYSDNKMTGSDFSAYEYIPCVITKDAIFLSLRFLSPLTGPAGQLTVMHVLFRKVSQHCIPSTEMRFHF